jgi:hypothetical protein
MIEMTAHNGARKMMKIFEVKFFAFAFHSHFLPSTKMMKFFRSALRALLKKQTVN